MPMDVRADPEDAGPERADSTEDNLVDGDNLADSFAEVARQLRAEADPRRTRQRVSVVAVAMVPGCDHASISLIARGGRITTVAATDDIPAQVDAIQYQTQQGPCVDSIAEHEINLVDDLGTDARWPKFSRRAVDETGVRSMLAFRLFVDDDTIGALNLYSRKPEAFDDHARTVGAALAAHAAIAMVAAREKEHAENLEIALRTSRQIGTAIGILMSAHRLTEAQALTALKEASQNSNTKLRDIAAEVIATGALPAPDTVR